MDQCQNIRAEVAKAQDVYDSLIKSSGPPDFKKPVGVAEALQTLNLKKANLAACIKAHIPFTITGDTPKPGSALTEFDKAIENFCRANNVRAGQLTILKGGIKKFEHGYTLAEPLYPITQVDSLFRIASVSKAFTCACIQTLQDQKKVKLVDAVFPLLGITKKALAGQNPDPNINKITVGNLVNHLGGWNDQGAGFFEGKKPVSSSSDPVFHIRQIATQMNLTRPPTKMDMARFMYGEPLQFTPGAAITGPKNYCYSNFGYMLLGLVVEKRSGMPYIDFLRQQVLAPIGVTDVFLARMLAGPIPREVTYDDAGSGLNALEPHANVTAPNPYGGFGAVTELMDSAGGLVASATAIAQFINKFMAWSLGHGRGGARSGEMSGTAAWAQSTGDVDLTFTFNTSTFPATRVFNDGKNVGLTDQLDLLVKAAKF